MKKVYLATPYSDPDPRVRNKRFLAANRAASKLMMQGILVFSPISHTHPIALAGEMPKGWEFWKDYVFTFIDGWADEVWVLQQSGWKDSVGVTAEIKLAAQLGKPIKYLTPSSI